MTDSMGPGKLVLHMKNLSYTYDEYLICIGLGPSISSAICKSLSYSGPSYPSSPVLYFCILFYDSCIPFLPFASDFCSVIEVTQGVFITRIIVMLIIVIVYLFLQVCRLCHRHPCLHRLHHHKTNRCSRLQGHQVRL